LFDDQPQPQEHRINIQRWWYNNLTLVLENRVIEKTSGFREQLLIR
jgi:hypothetical protein